MPHAVERRALAPAFRSAFRSSPNSSLSNDPAKTTMSYFRTRFRNFEEFQREGLQSDLADLGKDEIELLRELEDDERRLFKPRRRRSSWE